MSIEDRRDSEDGIRVAFKRFTWITRNAAIVDLEGYGISIDPNAWILGKDSSYILVRCGMYIG